MDNKLKLKKLLENRENLISQLDPKNILPINKKERQWIQYLSNKLKKWNPSKADLIIEEENSKAFNCLLNRQHEEVYLSSNVIFVDFSLKRESHEH